MMVFVSHDSRTLELKLWCVVIGVIMAMAMKGAALDGPNVCMVKQKYNITKLVKYRAPMSVRTYEWCFSMPPRCSKWNTEMRDLTRHETEERTAEVAVCCPGYKMKDVSCVPICPNGKTGPGCSEDCPDNKWGPNCIHDCNKCKNGFCSPLTGECECLEGWQGESCDTSMPITTAATTTLEELLTTLTNKPTSPNTTPRAATTTAIATTTRATTPTTRITTSSTTTAVPLTRPVTTSDMTTLSTLQTSTTARAIKTDEIISWTISTEPPTMVKTNDLIKTTEAYTTVLPTTTPVKNISSTATESKETLQLSEEVTQRIMIKPIYNRTEPPYETTKYITIANKPVKGGDQNKLTEVITTTELTKPTAPIPMKEITLKTDITKKETTIRIHPTTVKFKPKEIWIRPAQKGESPIIETKIKPAHDSPRYRSANHKDFTPINTTPKTIIVSIIPTSVSYSTFKKIALTTASLLFQKNATFKSYKKTENEVTKPMEPTTLTPHTMSTSTRKHVHSTIRSPIKNVTVNSPRIAITNVIKQNTTVTLIASTTTESLITKSLEIPKTVLLINKTNSMTDANEITSTSVTTNERTPKQINMTAKTDNTSSSTTDKAKQIVSKTRIKTTTPINTILNVTNSVTQKDTNIITGHKNGTILVTNKIDTKTTTPKENRTTAVTTKLSGTNSVTLKGKVTGKDFRKTNVTKPLTSTEGPNGDEEFHILTEPEHITAVMGDKDADRSSVDLISAISIAGGLMMAVITVAVIIVMMERCKRPRYEDVRKINDIRMQVMIDSNDEPPPYVRSIFHTPLPDPPTSDKCHYQPISTLDRNLKQFMRPVVVQTISPIMLENFRGILECHYDHLPRRSHDFGTMQSRRSVAPSMNDCSELRHLRASVTESAIEALKCEAKLDIIDNSTAEPLYAEIPCWRPPSEHAVEIMNLNGEAVTEL